MPATRGGEGARRHRAPRGVCRSRVHKRARQCARSERMGAARSRAYKHGGGGGEAVTAGGLRGTCACCGVRGRGAPLAELGALPACVELPHGGRAGGGARVLCGECVKTCELALSLAELADELHVARLLVRPKHAAEACEALRGCELVRGVAGGAAWRWGNAAGARAPFPSASHLHAGVKYNLVPIRNAGGSQGDRASGARLASAVCTAGVLRLRRVESTQRCLVGQALFGTRGDRGHASEGGREALARSSSRSRSRSHPGPQTPLGTPTRAW